MCYRLDVDHTNAGLPCHKMLRTEEGNKQHFPDGGILIPNGRKSLLNEMEDFVE